MEYNAVPYKLIMSLSQTIIEAEKSRLKFRRNYNADKVMRQSSREILLF